MWYKKPKSTTQADQIVFLELELARTKARYSSLVKHIFRVEEQLLMLTEHFNLEFTYVEPTPGAFKVAQKIKKGESHVCKS
jgi:hypothetical protein